MENAARESRRLSGKQGDRSAHRFRGKRALESTGRGAEQLDRLRRRRSWLHTPATNLIALRRLALRVGESADAPAAYLAFPAMRFVKLAQTYHRMGRTEYEYAAPSVGYAGSLDVLPSGAVARYPGLFELVTSD